MTILVAAIEQGVAWMLADSLITGGQLGPRDREHKLKIVPSTDKQALIGFSGDEHHGSRFIQRARLLPAGPDTVEILVKWHLEHPSVVFAYAYRFESETYLIRISEGKSLQVPTLHLGVEAGFAQFQGVRHRQEIDPVPKSASLLMIATRSVGMPEGLGVALKAMLRLFPERTERDVGGFALPYYLNQEGTSFCNYGYSVSDPILPDLNAGAILPHGTAERGGVGLSVTELETFNGVVVYWLQQSQGTVFVMDGDVYKEIVVAGEPSEFKRAASEKVGLPISIWFDDCDPEEPVTNIKIMSDARGIQRYAIAQHGRSLLVSVLDATGVHEATWIDRLESSPISAPTTESFGATLIEGGVFVRLGLFGTNGVPASTLQVDAAGVDAIIATLGSLRAGMKEQISDEPPHSPGTSEVVAVDPAWRTNVSPHPSLDGLMLRLRHNHLGWQSFLLPHHEAIALAQWLSNNARR